MQVGCDTSAHRVSTQVNVLQEALCDAEQARLWPRLEPVNHRRVDRGQEALAADPEVVPDRRRREHHVQVLLDLADERGPAVVVGVWQAVGLGLGAHRVDDVVFVFDREEVGDLAGGKEVVDEDEHLLVHNL